MDEEFTATTSIAATTSTISTASASSTISSTSVTSTSLSTLLWSGLVHLDLLPVNGLSVHFLGCSLGIFLAVEGHKCKALAGVVDIGHHAELFKFGLKVPIGHILVHPIDEEFTALLSHDTADVVLVLL